MVEPGLGPYGQDTQRSKNDTSWIEIYATLQKVARRLVISGNIAIWKGQEYDIEQDIVQETVRRLYEYKQKADTGKVKPIRSLEHFMIKIAHNKYRDYVRQGRRFVSIRVDEQRMDALERRDEQIDIEQEVIEKLDEEVHFVSLARSVDLFPLKQKKAFLIDLANSMSFGVEETTLQKAFRTAGIHLQDYQQVLSEDKVERRRHQSLLYEAYKRIRLLHQVEDVE